MEYHVQEDTDGGSSYSYECVTVSAECEGLTGDALTECLSPACCIGDGCPVDIDVAGKQFTCYSAPAPFCDYCQ